MEKLREMNRDLFKTNLIKTIEEIKGEMNLSVGEMKFKIVAIQEPGEPLNARDDSMRLVALSEKMLVQGYYLWKMLQNSCHVMFHLFRYG